MIKFLKKGKVKLSVFLVIMILIQTIIPLNASMAAKDYQDFDYWTSIKFLDSENNQIKPEIPVGRDSFIRIKFDYEIPNDILINIDKDYIINIPEEIKIIDNMTIELKDNNIIYGKVEVREDNTATLRFNEKINENLLDRKGYFQIDTKFNSEKVKDKDEITLDFDIIKDLKDNTIKFKDEGYDLDLSKKGEFNKEDKTITWTNTIDYKPLEAGISLNNIKFIDKLDLKNQEIIKDSWKIEPENPGEFIYKDETLIYEFKEPLNKETKIDIEFKTRLNFTLDSIFETKLIKNKSRIEYEGDRRDSNEVTIEVNPCESRKLGEYIKSYDGELDKINWTVYVNRDKQIIENPVLTDILPEGTKLIKDSVSVNNEKIESSKLEYNDSTREMKLSLGKKISDLVTVKYTTEVTNDEIKNFTNEYTIEGSNDYKNSGEATVQNKGILDKYGENYNAINQVATWKVDINKAGKKLDKFTFKDELPEYLELISMEVEEPEKHKGLEYKKLEDGNYGIEFKDGLDKETARIKIKTKIKEEYKDKFKVNEYGQLDNTAYLIFDNEELKIYTNITLPVYVEKNLKEYDYSKNVASWEIKILPNRDGANLKNYELKDIIKDNQELIKDSVVINPNSEDIKLDIEDGNINISGDILNYGDSISIKFRTKVKDEAFTENNEKIIIKNTASFKTNDNYDELSIEDLKVSDEKEIEVNLIRKDGSKYENGKSYIPWIITINKDQLKLRGVVLTDKLAEELIYREDSMKIRKLNKSEDGKFSIEKELSKAEIQENFNIEYDNKTRIFKIEFKDKDKEIENPFQFEFITDIDETKIEPDEYQKIKTDIKNRIDLKGEYTDKETKTIETYDEYSLKVEFQIGEGGGSSSTRGKVELIKVDEEGKVLSGAEFTLEDSKGKVVTKVSGTDGKVVFENLENGKYTLKETKAPEGFEISSKPYEFEIKSDNLKIDLEKVENKKIPTEPEEKGKVELIKVDEEGKVLSGAEFTLEDSKGKVVTKVSGTDGKVVFENLENGKYTLKETKAPEGFEISEKVYEFEIKSDKLKIDLEKVENKKTPTEPEEKGKVELIKVDEDGKVLSGAEFTLYNSNGKKLVTKVSGSNGKVVFDNLENGKYTLKETKAPTGFVLSKVVYRFEINSDNLKIDLGQIENTKPSKPTPPEPEEKGKVELIKVDEDGKVLSGAEFTLYNSNGEKVGTKTSGSNGKVVFDNLEKGKYKVKETKAPEGFVLSKVVYRFEIKSGNLLINLGEIENTKPSKPTPPETEETGKVELIKVDGKDKVLSDAEFTIYNEKGKKIKTILSDENGKVVFDNLDIGKYLIKETQAPKGYKNIDKIYEVEIKSDKLEVNLGKIKNKKIEEENKPNNQKPGKEKPGKLPATGIANTLEVTLLGLGLIGLGGYDFLRKRK